MCLALAWVFGTALFAGLVAGLVARRRGLALGALAALPGLALVTLLYL